MKQFYLKLLTILFEKYYSSIEDIPVSNFYKCLSGDLTGVSKGRYYNYKKLKQKWEVIFNEDLKEHGLPEVYERYIEKMKKAMALYQQAYSGEKWKILKARIYEQEAKNMISQQGERIETTCARISKYMGYPVRANECTMLEFRNYIAIMMAS